MPKPKWTKFSEEEIISFVAESKSFSQLLKRMGYNPISGTARKSIVKMLDEKGIDYSHFLGQGWNKKEIQNLTSLSLIKEKLIIERGHRCEKCGLSFWLEVKIPLEIHHINGDHQDNSTDNLVLLCPNCHALTDNYKGKNRKNNFSITDEEFLQALEKSSNIHQACLLLGITPNQSSYNRARRLILKR